MSSSFTAPTTYFLQEGRENLRECLQVAFQAAVQHNIEKIVIFTAYGDGVKLAIESFCSQHQYQHIRLVAVTFPAGRIFTNDKHQPMTVRIADETMALMTTSKVPLVRAHLPFDPVEPGSTLQTIDSGFALLAEALDMFCGSMKLCIQAIALACDAGHIETGDHVISLTSDTAILAQAAVTSSMLSRLIIREILCKPAVLTIARKETRPSIEEPDRDIESSELKKSLGPKQLT
jgi:uncharacterized protein